jgi:hypothetical protein
MKLFAKIALLEFVSALIIVAATRAYVIGSYKWTAVTEVVFVTQWFWSRNLSFDEPAARSWKVGYPAYMVGAVAGTLLGLFVSLRVLGQ